MMRSTLPGAEPEAWPVFFSAVPRMADGERELELCRSEAARQAAMFLRVSGLDMVVGTEQSGTAVTLQNTSWKYDTGTAAQLLPELEVIEEFSDAEGRYILARFPSLSFTEEISDLAPTVGSIQESPGWVRRLPSLPGYRVAVGSAARKRLFAESVEAADRSALAGLLAESAVVVAGVGGRTDAREGTAKSAGRAQLAAGTVSGFYILDRWVSPGGDTFYTLAICERYQ